jgi:hypothetical protein
MLPTKCRFIWPNGFRGEEFLKSANQKQESPMATMFVNGSGRNERYLQRIFHRCFLPSFGSFVGRLCKLEKRGDEIKKKHSPLKVLSQSQPNFAEMIKVWLRLAQ